MRLSALALLLVVLAVPAGAQGVYLEQIGTLNQAEVVQSAAALAVTEVRVTQVGAGHVALVDQRRDGSVDAVQDGVANVLAGWSLGAGDPSAFALVADGSELVLRQDGSDNRAFVEQREGAFAEVLQLGVGNTALLFQSGGLGNQAFIDQTGGAWARVTQTGAGNLARITQTDTFP